MLAEYLEKGDRLLQEGKHLQAVATYTEAVQSNLLAAVAHYKLGSAFLFQHRWEEARNCFDCALDIDSDFFWAHWGFGQLGVAQEQWNTAAQALRRAIQLDPNFPWTYPLLGDVLTRQEQWEEAIALYRRGIELKPDLPGMHDNLWKVLLTVAAQQPDSHLVDRAYLTELFQATQIDPVKSLAYFEELAQIAMRTKQWQLALDRWNLLLDNVPLHFSASVSKGNVLLQLGKMEQAEKLFQALTVDYPEHLDGFVGFAQVAMLDQQYQIALERWNYLLKTFPHCLQAQMGQAYCLMELGEFQQADQLFQTLTLQHSNHTDCLEGFARVAMRAQQWLVAIDRWNTLLQLHPQHFSAQIGKGYCLVELEEFEQAEVLFQALMVQHPAQIDCFEGFARTAMRAQQCQIALQRWNHLLENFPQHLPAQIGQAYCLMEVGELSRAEALFRELTLHYPKRIDCAEGFARVAMRSQQNRVALDRWNDLLERVPNHLPAQIGQAYCLMELGELRQAETIFQLLTQQHPQLIEGFEGYAQVAMREERWLIAVDRWNQVIHHFPNHTIAYTSKGGALLRLENFIAAENTLKEIYTQQPHHPFVLQGLSHVAHYTNRWELLLEAFNSFIEHYSGFWVRISEKNDFVRVLKEILLLLTLDGKLQAVADYIQKLEEYQVPFWKIALWKANLAREQGNSSLAEQICQDLLAQDLVPAEQNQIYAQLLTYARDDFRLADVVEIGRQFHPIQSKVHFEAFRDFIEALIKLEKIEEAKQELAHFIHLYPVQALPHLFLIQIFLFCEFNYGAALEACNFALDSGVLTQRIYCYKALALSALGKTDEALQLLDTCIEKTLDHALMMICRAQVLRVQGYYTESIAALNYILSQDGFYPLTSTGPHCELNIQYLQCSPPEITDQPKLVSVIMTTYRRDDLLPVAIASILIQTYRNLELIIVDDHSPDDTFEFLKTLVSQDHRIKVLQMPCNCGTYIAKNHGLQQARGEYITFMDADDWSHPQRIAAQVQALENSESVAVTCGFFRIHTNSDIEFKPEEALGQAHITILFKAKPVLEHLGFFDAVRTGADTEHFCRITTRWGAGAIKRIKAPLLIATRHAQSITGGGTLGFPWYGPGCIDGIYAAAFNAWHRSLRNQNLSFYISHPLNDRRFNVPEILMP